MKAYQKKAGLISILLFFFLLLSLSFASAQEHHGMMGANSTSVFFDMRDGNPQSAAIHLKLIQDTYNEYAAMKKNPVFVVVFMGPSVRLISTNQSGFKPDEQKFFKDISDIITGMSKSGINIEVCLFAAKVFNIEPASILPGIKHVGNGWISEIDYQNKGYKLVPVY
jgi:intracellular sulfur oxidation DsrE/DsrF family protein